AVPANMARAVMQQIVRFGEVRRGRLGIQMQDVAGRDGAAIAQIQPDSPAEKAGLRAGDIVTAVNGRPVRGAAELRAQLGIIPVGENVEMRVQRGAEQRSIRARIGELEARGAGGGGETLAQLAGALLRDAERAGVRGKERVVLVTAVEAGSAAFQAGLRPGDLILAVNRRRVTSVAALGKALAGSEAAALNVVRGDFLLTIALR
ncbi:MAG: PDZ domain-containing protein, partial [Betaproteobacteria bacterium]